MQIKFKLLKIKPAIGAIVILVFGVLFVIQGVQDGITLRKWDSGEVLEYQGEFVFSEKKYARNTNYIFVLGNGDTISCDSFGEDIADIKRLNFRYTRHVNILGDGAHTAVSIASIDNNYVFLQEEVSKRDICIGATAWSVLGFVSIFVSASPWLLSLLPFVFSVRRRLKKHHKKLNAKRDRSNQQ